jgi:hypothetical protein
MISGNDIVSEVLRAPAVNRERRLGHEDVEAILRKHGWVLPPEHERLLSTSGGMTAFGGYYRLFSASRMKIWNAEEAWKFAWPADVRRFLCFGETAFGDQYAYRLDEMGRGKVPRVYFLEAIALSAEVLNEDFASFLRNEFLRNSEAAYDPMIAGARRLIGDLDVSERVTYSPSPLVTGEESLESVVKMDATAAMIIAGDLASQLADESGARPIRGVETFEDNHGRTRLRVVW